MTDNGAPAFSVTNTFSVTVNEVNVAPALTVPADQRIDELTNLNVTNTATDTDIPANVLTFSLGNHPTGMTITPDTGIINWTPTEAQGPSSNLVEVIVTDDGSPILGTTNTFAVVVNEVNSAPSLTVPANQTINEQTLLGVSASASDSDIPANTLTFSLPSAPVGMTIDPNTGAITWTPSEADGPAVYTVSVAVTDDGSPALSVTNSFTVTVNEVNTAPSLPAIANRTIHAGQTVTFTNSATDSDLPANMLTYTLDPGAPGAASVGSTSGVFAWATTSSDANTTNAITVRVTDDGTPGTPALDNAKSFTVTVVLAPTADISVSGNVVRSPGPQSPANPIASNTKTTSTTRLGPIWLPM